MSIQQLFIVRHEINIVIIRWTVPNGTLKKKYNYLKFIVKKIMHTIHLIPN